MLGSKKALPITAVVELPEALRDHALNVARKPYSNIIQTSLTARITSLELCRQCEWQFEDGGSAHTIPKPQVEREAPRSHQRHSCSASILRCVNSLWQMAMYLRTETWPAWTFPTPLVRGHMWHIHVRWIFSYGRKGIRIGSSLSATTTSSN